MIEISAPTLLVQPRTKPPIYFWRGAVRASRRLECRCQKAQK